MFNREICLCCGGVLYNFTEISGYSILKCKNCGTAYTFPRVLDVKCSEKAYKTQYYNSLILPQLSHWLLKNFLFRFRINTIKLLLKTGKILDFGCGAGEFTSLLGKTSWSVYAMDTSESACKIAGNKGIEVYCGELKNAPYRKGFFDLIFSSYVLEHLSDPGDVIGRLNNFITPGGYLYIEVPNYSGLFFSKIQNKWLPKWDIPIHYNHFTRKGLLSLMEKHGFLVLKENHGLLTGFLHLSYLTTVYFKEKFGSRWLGLIGAFIMTPINIVATLVGYRGSLEIIFQKDGR